MKSSSGSSLIATFTEQNHAAKLKGEQLKLVSFSEQIKKRREKVKKGQTDDDFGSVLAESERYKAIDFHKISFVELEKRF